MLEKEKRKQPPSRRRWRKIALAGFIGMAIITLWLILSPIYPPGSRDFIKTSLDAEYIPTAEFLLANPERDVEFIRFEVFDEPYFTNEQVISEKALCVHMEAPWGKGNSLFMNTEIFLNGKMMAFSGSIYHGGMGGLVSDSFERIRRCGYMRNINPGIHLLEVRMKYSLYESPFHVHQWAFVIES